MATNPFASTGVIAGAMKTPTYRPGDTNELGQAINTDGSLYTGGDAMTRDQYNTLQNQQKQSQLYVNYNNAGGVTDQVGYDAYMGQQRAEAAKGRQSNPYAGGAANAFAAPGSASAPSADPLEGYSAEQRATLGGAIAQARAPQGAPAPAPSPANTPAPTGVVSENFNQRQSSMVPSGPITLSADEARQYIANYADLQDGFANRATSPAEWGLQNATEEEWANAHLNKWGLGENRTWLPVGAPPPAPTPGRGPGNEVPSPPPSPTAPPAVRDATNMQDPLQYFRDYPDLLAAYMKDNQGLSPAEFAQKNLEMWGAGEGRNPGNTVDSTGFVTAGQKDWAVTNDQLVENRLEGIISRNSPLMQQAAARALQQQNERGLLNSSMAVGAAQDAVVQNALPIAGADAGTYADAAKTNAAARNSQYQFNAGQRNTSRLAEKELAQKGSQFDRSLDLDRDRLDETARQFDSNQRFTGGENSLERQNRIDIAKLNTENQRLITELEQKYKTSLQNDSTFASQFELYQRRTQEIDNDANLSAEAKVIRKQEAAKDLEVYAKIIGLDLKGLLDFRTTTPAPAPSPAGAPAPAPSTGVIGGNIDYGGSGA